MRLKSTDESQRPQRQRRKSKIGIEAENNACVGNLSEPAKKRSATNIVQRNKSTPIKMRLKSTDASQRPQRQRRKSKICIEAENNACVGNLNEPAKKRTSTNIVQRKESNSKSGRFSKVSKTTVEKKLNQTIENDTSLSNSLEYSFEIQSPKKILKLTLKRIEDNNVSVQSEDEPLKMVLKRTPILKTKPSKTTRNHKNALKHNLFEKALSVLHSSAVPSSLPCRENEFFAVYNFIKGKLLEESGGCMYISGVPGTGKTATVYEVIRNLREECEIEDIPEFKFIEINGLQLTDPYQCYVQLFKELSGKKTSSQNAANLLDKRFTKPSKDETEPIVLLVDELDLLCTRKQTILYHLFEWPNKPRSKLIVISIANTMDLPERVMMNRVSSRLGMSRLTFQPYNHKELQAILESRLIGLDAFDCDGVQLIARKVAAISGDARRALDICRRAVEIAETDIKNGAEQFVTMKHVDKSLQDIFSSPRLMAIRNASMQEQTFLRSIVQDFRITGLEEAKFIDVYRHHCSICKFEGFYTPTTNELFQVASNLFDIRLILIDNNGVDLQKRIRLQVSVDDVMFSLNKKH